MRALSALLVALCLLLPAAAQPATSRFGVALDARQYPQATPKEALASVVKAIEGSAFSYLTAQLSDPSFIDDRVQRLYGGQFAEQVDDVRTALGPSARLLKRFLAEGKWTTADKQAVVRLADVDDRCVRLVQVGGRWYLAHAWELPASR